MRLQDWIREYPEEARDSIREWWDPKHVAECCPYANLLTTEESVRLGHHIRWCLEQGYEAFCDKEERFEVQHGYTLTGHSEFEYEDIDLDQRMRLAEAHQEELESNPYGRREP